VSKTPGKTRACNVFRIDSGWYLVDLPGYGFARASRSERAAFRNLVSTFVQRREPLAGVVWLLDIRREPSRDDLAMAGRLASRGVPLLAAITKADKLPYGQRAARAREIAAAVDLPLDQCVVTSATAGIGIDDLRDSIEAFAAGRTDDRVAR
jgi:GTP-binding protein